MLIEKNLVSVIIPVYNGEKFVLDALQTIYDQKYKPLEIIIVDDGSTDKTAEKVPTTDKNIKYIYQENAGPSSARNKGLTMAKGEFVVFLDIDDLWMKDRLKKYVSFLLEHSEIDVVMGQIQCFCLSDNKEGKYEKYLEPFVSFNIGAALFRKSVFKKVGIFDEKLRFGEDTDWFMRAREKNIGIKVFQEISLLHRFHESNMTKGKNMKELNVFKVLKMSIHRRKKQGKGNAQSLEPVVTRE